MVVKRAHVLAVAVIISLSFAGCVGSDGGSLSTGSKAKLKLESFGVPSEPVALGDVARITFTVLNDGEGDGSFAIQLLVDGEVHVEKTFRVFAGARESSSFEFSPTDPGEYVIELAASVIGSGATTEVYGGPSTIVVEKAALLVPVRMQLSHTEAPVGDEVSVQVTVENQGEQPGELKVPLKLDGETIREKSITLDGGASGIIEFTFSSEARGWRSVSVPGLDAQNVEFYLPATFEIANLNVDDDTPYQGREFGYSFTIRNIGDREGSITYTVALDGQTLRSESVKISGSADTQVTGSAKPGRAGATQLSVDVIHDQASLPLTVAGPNLAIQVTKHPYNSDYACYDEAYVSFSASNSGQGPADDVQVELWLNGAKTTIAYGDWQGTTLTKGTDSRLGEISGGSSVPYNELRFHVVDYCGQTDNYDLVIKLTSAQGVFTSNTLSFGV